MRIIKTLKDLTELRQRGDMDEPFLDRLEADFRMMMEALRFDESEEEFNLEQHGYMVLLDDHEDPRCLRGVGLDPEECGLLGTWPEWVDKIELPGRTVFKICVLYDNEYMMTFYAGLDHDPEALAWAESHVA